MDPTEPRTRRLPLFVVAGMAVGALTAYSNLTRAHGGTPEEVVGRFVGTVVGGGFFGLLVGFLWARRWKAAGIMIAGWALLFGAVVLLLRPGRVDAGAFHEGCVRSCEDTAVRGASPPGSPSSGPAPERIRTTCDCICREFWNRSSEETHARIARADATTEALVRAEWERLATAVSATCAIPAQHGQ